MDARIFIDEPMDLLAELQNVKLSERVSYDADRNILFLNLEGYSVRKKSDVTTSRRFSSMPARRPASVSSRS